MVRRAQADNTSVCLMPTRRAFALDATHRPHLTLVQQFVRTADLDKVYAAANQVLAKGKAGGWNLEGVQVLLHSRSTKRYSRALSSSPQEDLLRLQQGLLDAVAPFTEKTGTARCVRERRRGGATSSKD